MADITLPTTFADTNVTIADNIAKNIFLPGADSFEKVNGYSSDEAVVSPPAPLRKKATDVDIIARVLGSRHFCCCLVSLQLPPHSINA